MSSKPPLLPPEKSPSISDYLLRAIIEPQLQVWHDFQEPRRIIQQLEEDNENLEEDIVRKDRTIKTQKTTIEAQKKTFEENSANKDKTIRAHEATIESLKEIIEAQKATIEAQRKTSEENSANKDKTIRAHEATIESLEKNIAGLEQQTDMKKSLDDLKTSMNKRFDESQTITGNNDKFYKGYLTAINSDNRTQYAMISELTDVTIQVLSNQASGEPLSLPKQVADPKAAAESSPKMLHQFQNSAANTSNASTKTPSPNGPTEAPPKPSPSKP